MILPFWSFIWSHVKILTLCQSLSRKLSYYVKLKEVWYNKNLTMKFLQIFLSCLLKENMYKSGLKTGGHHALFWILEVKRSKILQILNKRDCFYLHSLQRFAFFTAFLAQNLIYTTNIYLTLCLADFLNKIIY